MKVAVIFGGSSEERDVSIASGLEVISAMRSRGQNVIAVDTARGLLSEDAERALKGFKVLKNHPGPNDLGEFRNRQPAAVANTSELKDVDVVFIALHGGSGENGTFQAFFEVSGIPFTGSGRVASTIAMDKDISKRLMLAASVATPAWQMCAPEDESIDVQLGYPLIVKPNAQGSTIGLSLVRNRGELKAAIEKAGKFDKEVMLEAFVSGREFTVGVLDGHPLAVGEIVAPNEIFDYSSKYQQNGANEIFPAAISLSKTQEIQELAVRVHKALKLSGYSRIDFRMDELGKFWCLEANSVPGLTPTSLLPQSAKAAGIEFPELCERICLLGIKQHNC